MGMKQFKRTIIGLFLLASLVLISGYSYYKYELSQIDGLIPPKDTELTDLELNYLNSKLGYSGNESVKRYFGVLPFIQSDGFYANRNDVDRELIISVTRDLLFKHQDKQAKTFRQGVGHLKSYLVANYLSHNWTIKELAKYHVKSISRTRLLIHPLKLTKGFIAQFGKPTTIEVVDRINRGILKYKEPDYIGKYTKMCWELDNNEVVCIWSKEGSSRVVEKAFFYSDITY